MPDSQRRYVGFHQDMPWATAIEAYYSDDMPTAMRLAEHHGLGTRGGYLGFFRTIEAEYVTRQSCVLTDSGEWLLLEAPEELVQPVEVQVRGAADQVAEMFGWEHGPRVLFTILDPDTNAPFVPGRDGYFVDKTPYDKVCLPHALIRREPEFGAAVRHEYAHAMVLNRAQGRCPLWLNEAVAMVAQTGGRTAVRGVWNWLTPDALDLAYREDRESFEGSPVVASAYRQSNVLGSYLASLQGPLGIGKLLDSFVDNSFVQELVMRVKNQRPEDEALRQVYGFGLVELFERARSFAA